MKCTTCRRNADDFVWLIVMCALMHSLTSGHDIIIAMVKIVTLNFPLDVCTIGAYTYVR